MHAHTFSTQKADLIKWVFFLCQLERAGMEQRNFLVQMRWNKTKALHLNSADDVPHTRINFKAFSQVIRLESGMDYNMMYNLVNIVVLMCVVEISKELFKTPSNLASL